MTDIPPGETHIMTRVRKPRRDRDQAPTLYLTLGSTLYRVSRDRDPSADVDALFRLQKPDGSAYDVAQTAFGPVCDCPDFVFRRDGLDPTGCKHVKGLTAYGLLPPAT